MRLERVLYYVGKLYDFMITTVAFTNTSCMLFLSQFQYPVVSFFTFHFLEREPVTLMR